MVGSPNALKCLEVKCAYLESDTYEVIILGNKVCSIKPNLSLARENIFCCEVELPEAEVDWHNEDDAENKVVGVLAKV